MLRAERANVVLDIEDEDVDFYVSKGYSIYNGRQLVKRAAPNTLDDYKLRLSQALDIIDGLNNRVAELEREIENLKKKKNPQK